MRHRVVLAATDYEDYLGTSEFSWTKLSGLCFGACIDMVTPDSLHYFASLDEDFMNIVGKEIKRPEGYVDRFNFSTGDL